MSKLQPEQDRANHGNVLVAGDHRKIARGFFLIASFVLIGKSFGALKEILVAYRFGMSPIVDSYLYVFNLTQWPVGVLSGVIAAVMVPLIVRTKDRNQFEQRVFQGECLWVFTLVGLFLGAIACFAVPLLIKSPHSGLSGHAQPFALSLVIPLAVLIPLGLLARLLAAWTMANHRHTNTLFESLSALAIVLCLVLSASSTALVLGTVVGVTAEMIALGVVLWRSGDLARPRFSWSSPLWSELRKAFAVMLVGQLLMSFVDLIDQFVAAGLEAGSIACLGYSNRIVGLILSLAATAIGRAILPVLSETHLRSEASVYGISRMWALGLFILGAVMVAITSLFCQPIVQILFERGEFGPSETARVAELLSWSLVKIPGYLSSMVLTYALMSQRKTKVVALLGGISLGVKVVLAAILVPTLGLPGLALSTAGVYLASSVFALFFLARRV